MEPHYIYSTLITYAGASVLHQCKKAGIAVSSTLDLESVATVKGSELGIYAQIVLKALGTVEQLPTTILTDNYSNQRISQEARSAANSRYFLVRYTCLHHRITDGKFIVSHVPDGEMPADAFTKALPTAKTAASTAYALGQPIDYQPKPRRKPDPDVDIAEQQSPLLDTVENAVDDAFIAHDGPYTEELDAALCSRIDESSMRCRLEAAVTDVEAHDTMSRHEICALVVALKVKHPKHTRQQIHQEIREAGGNCSLSQVKRVRVGFSMAQERERQRMRSFELARQGRAPTNAAAADAVNVCASGSAVRYVRSDRAAELSPMLEALKATQNVIDVKTEIGTRVYVVPSSTKGVQKSQEKELWIEADRSALTAILVCGNRLVRIDSVPHGTPIAPCVTARRLKLDQATGMLEKFKSRHALDGARLASLRARLGLPPPATGTCNIIDDMALKLLFADLARRNRFFAKLDIGDAYLKAKRLRARGYMYMPDTITEYDADGTKMVIELNTPLWGETEAGFEWDIELHERLLAIGWLQCAGVPAMYYFESPSGDARLIKIVDDLGISESSAAQPITKATLAALKAAYNNAVTHDFAPTSFAGFKLDIDRSGEHTTVALSQGQKVTEAVRKYMPELLA